MSSEQETRTSTYCSLLTILFRKPLGDRQPPILAKGHAGSYVDLDRTAGALYGNCLAQRILGTNGAAALQPIHLGRHGFDGDALLLEYLHLKIALFPHPRENWGGHENADLCADIDMYCGCIIDYSASKSRQNKTVS